MLRETWMALTRRKIGTISIDLEGVLGDLGTLDGEKAVRRAQEKNAIVYEQEVKERARNLIKGDPGERRDRNRGSYPDSMVDYYNAEVQGLDIIADNPTSRADWFEFGTEAHEIVASGRTEAGRQTPSRGLRGQFTRGARYLRFAGPGGIVFATSVWHPGQKATLVMEETMTDLLDVFADNIGDELEREWERA